MTEVMACAGNQLLGRVEATSLQSDFEIGTDKCGPEAVSISDFFSWSQGVKMRHARDDADDRNGFADESTE
jgi:hypothetical protein